MIVNFEFRPRPDEQTQGVAIEMDAVPRTSDYIDVGEHVYTVQRVQWALDSYEADNNGSLTITVVCDRVR